MPPSVCSRLDFIGARPLIGDDTDPPQWNLMVVDFRSVISPIVMNEVGLTLAHRNCIKSPVILPRS